MSGGGTGWSERIEVDQVAESSEALQSLALPQPRTQLGSACADQQPEGVGELLT